VNVVVNARFSQHKTGVGRVIENLLRQLARIDRENTYYVYVNPEFVDLFRFDNDKFVVLSNGVPAANSLKNHIWTQTGLLWAIRKHKADLVLLPQINLLLFKLRPIVLFQYDLIEYHVPNQKWYKMAFRRFAIPRACRLADKVITISQSSVTDLRRFLDLPPEKIELIYTAVDHDHLQPRDPVESRRIACEKYGVKGDYILYVGTLTLPQKNLVRVVEAFKILRDRGCQAQLLMAGAFGKDHQLILQRIRELGLGPHTLVPGYVDDRDLPYLYSAARAFCFPSLYEGFGLPVLEAMACGCPIVTSNVSSMPEVAGDAGAQVDPYDPQAIADALDELLTNDEVRRQRIRQGLEQARRFSWESAGRQLLDVINSFNGVRTRGG
jgi:glycosyltransferase involved in cell wall biosynthesis